MQLSLRPDDPVRGDVGRIETGDERRDAFAVEPQQRSGGLVDLLQRLLSCVDGDRHHLLRLRSKQVAGRMSPGRTVIANEELKNLGSPAVTAIGFSQSTCTPAFAARIVYSACIEFGSAI